MKCYKCSVRSFIAIKLCHKLCPSMIYVSFSEIYQRISRNLEKIRRKKELRRESFLLIGRSFDPFLYTFCKMCRVSSEGKCKYCNFHHTHNLSHLNIITNGHFVINTFNMFRLTVDSDY